MSEEVLIQFEDYDIVNNTKEEIDILVGMSSPQFHEHRIIKGEPNGLLLIETPFGNCVIGPVPRGRDGNYQRDSIRVHNVSVTDCKLENEDKCLNLEAELAGIYKECQYTIKTDDEIKFEKIMETAWQRNDDSRFQVRLPWKLDPNTLDNNRVQAVSRDIRIYSQLKKSQK